MWDLWESLRWSTHALTSLGGSSEFYLAESVGCDDWSFGIRCRRSVQGSSLGELADLANMCESVVYADYLFNVARRGVKYGTNRSPPSFQLRRDFLVGDLLVFDLRRYDPGMSIFCGMSMVIM
ncbi:unnamed protein product [Prunus armeniaca]